MPHTPNLSAAFAGGGGGIGYCTKPQGLIEFKIKNKSWLAIHLKVGTLLQAITGFSIVFHQTEFAQSFAEMIWKYLFIADNTFNIFISETILTLCDNHHANYRLTTTTQHKTLEDSELQENWWRKFWWLITLIIVHHLN